MEFPRCMCRCMCVGLLATASQGPNVDTGKTKKGHQRLNKLGSKSGLKMGTLCVPILGSHFRLAQGFLVFPAQASPKWAHYVCSFWARVFDLLFRFVVEALALVSSRGSSSRTWMPPCRAPHRVRHLSAHFSVSLQPPTQVAVGGKLLGTCHMALLRSSDRARIQLSEQCR